MKRIADLSKSELLGLIYHNVRNGNVVFLRHPCICASCGNNNGHDLVSVEGTIVSPLYYVCDRCENEPEEPVGGRY
jgi:hypothetical protein